MTHNGIDARFQLTLSAFTLDVDLSLPARGITALFGPSGSGKTTLLRCIAGLEYAPGGRLSVKGEVWQDASHFLPTHRRSLAYVFQEASLFAHLNVRQNVDFGLRRVPRGQRRFALDQAIEWLGIGALLSRMPATLSGGERQRVSIARALATSPQLLLMDEPLAALDHARKNDILPYLERLHDALDIPVLYVSHSPDEVARLADHMVVLDAGRVIADGALTEVFSRPDLPLAQGEEASVVLDAVIAQHDPAYHLSRLDFAGGALWVRNSGDPVGKAVRVRILARDVSLTLAPQTNTSILNILPAHIVRMNTDLHPAQTLVWLEAGGAPLCARITRRSADTLGLQPGMPVWAQIKSVALLR